MSTGSATEGDAAVAFRASRRRLPVPAFRRNLWLLLLTILLAFTALGAQALVLNLYLVGVGFREDFLGLFSFANTAGIGVAAFLAGRTSNRIGPRRTLLIAVGVFAASSAGLVASTAPIPLLVVAAINGAALAHIFVPSATFVMDNADPTARSTAYSGYFTAQSIAMVVGSYVGGALPANLSPTSDITSGAYAVTLLGAAALAATGVVPMLMADDSRAQGSGATRLLAVSQKDQRRQMRRDVTWIIATSSFVAASMGFALPFINVYFSKALGASTEEIGGIFALASVAMVVASLAGPPIAKRFGVVPTIVVCRLITAPTLIFLALSPAVSASALVYIFRTLFTNITWPVDNAFTMEMVTPDFRATLSGIRSGTWNFAWALTSGVAGVMILQFGFPSIFFVSAGFMVIGSVTYFFAFRSRGAATSTVRTETAAVSQSA